MKYLSSVYTLKFLILLTSLFWYMEGKYYTQFSMEPEIHSFIHSFVHSVFGCPPYIMSLEHFGNTASHFTDFFQAKWLFSSI